VRLIDGVFASAVVVLLVLGAPVVATGAAPKAHLHAKLTPIAPARGGVGTFAASAVTAKSTVNMRWQLKLSNLSGTATKATMRLTRRKGVSFVLCAPCGSSRRGRVGMVRAVWDNMLTHGAQLVVATRAHPRGELRGIVRRG
jgi:hypothetical protein